MLAVCMQELAIGCVRWWRFVVGGGASQRGGLFIPALRQRGDARANNVRERMLGAFSGHISNQLVFNATFVPASLQSFRLNQANIFNCCFSVICVFDKQLYLLQEKFCVFVLDKVCQWFNL